MDNSPLMPRPIQVDSSKPQKGQRVGDKVPADDTNKNRTPVVLPRGRFKEKFQGLRERFDQVVGLHEELERDLELANARIRKLQAENDLLLDAINLTVPATPSLMHLTRPSPTLYSHSVAPPAAPPPPHHINGHSVPHANGRYRPVDPHDITTLERDRDRDYRDIPPETTVNGRL
ncbi:uncharacterized protein BJ212DRAFT_433005 [Suillus subaureus]|uniref:Uncharacterized protein n=1 Tax=Suillus subaureus TaxID=48587 RepID=A0A9P7E6K2_9AGAM|nr:uncharacterized protein BJ212DRAFT_433005 [Suillus subaureus]KAG1812810.1 hypothetical protein BJ212DRAFT_433005 [Suillus subaureus]